MPTSPETRYADTPDGSVAYQQFGDGPRDLVLVTDWYTPIETVWEDPRAERFFADLATFSRVVLFDNRGKGVSDPIPAGVTSVGPSMEMAAEDIGAVMDAVGSKQAAIFGIGFGCCYAAFFAATAPTRVDRLVLVDGVPRIHATDDYPTGLSQESVAHLLDQIITEHGTGNLLKLVDPAAYEDPQLRRWYARNERIGLPRKVVKLFWSSFTETEVGPALPAITAPTLVMNRAKSRSYPVEGGRYLAEHIPHAEFRELPGGDQLFFMANPNPIIEEAREFLTGVREAPAIDRILATILFTDIVGSTEQLARLGDRDWRDRLLRHHDLVRRELSRFRGREIDTAGDGFLATFDGPARAIQCAVAIREGVKLLDLQIRAGIHAGECELMGDKIGGIAVHTASRVMSTAKPEEILVSRTVKDLVAGSGLMFEDCGSHTLKGVPEPWQLFALREP